MERFDRILNFINFGIDEFSVNRKENIMILEIIDLSFFLYFSLSF